MWGGACRFWQAGQLCARARGAWSILGRRGCEVEGGGQVFNRPGGGHRLFGLAPPGEGEESRGSRVRSEDESPDTQAGSSPPQPLPRTGVPPLGLSLRARHRSLSPLERLSRLLPLDSLTQEVRELRESEGGETQGYGEGLVAGERQMREELEERQMQGERLPEGPTWGDCSSMDGEYGDSGCSKSQVPGTPSNTPIPIIPRELPLHPGELVLAEYRRKGQLEFRKMFELNEGGQLHSNWGSLAHSAVLGHPSGTLALTSTGTPLLLRRPSLEEYALLMKRGPTIAYPKDVSAMMMMMDVCERDSVLESGSGSGAMSLFLSRAVGSGGRVLSVELRKDHHRRALLNYQRWRKSWGMARDGAWPDNVEFVNKDLSSAADLLEGRSFHSVALDMLNPQVVLPTVFPHLWNGGVCAVYLANITQVVDLLEGVRNAGLPLLCERVIEVTHRDWVVAPAIRKDGSRAPRFLSTGVKGQHDEEKEEEGEPSCDQEGETLGRRDSRSLETVPYIARPHHEQGSHTAFLVKLRKVVPVPHHSRSGRMEGPGADTEDPSSHIGQP
ncbi:tRNA (adenine(58)-N(1))-methyltransferase, mitochondrial isoform X2 [Amia ocellicauda]|uniref:tRNA (adenine(58)-N(1))-methyltransferase, mitochondrial isoform X2 n=1 Tax=Amia ocellicauda TaxID=2972642 RepID=UPI0034639E75